LPGFAVKDPSAELDDVEMMSLRLVANWAKRARRSRALRGRGGNVWSALEAGLPAPFITPKRRTPADWGWWRLVQLRSFFAAEKRLAELELVIRVAEGAGLPGDRSGLEALRRGLAGVVEYLGAAARR
jgi:hypothetical protein